MGMAELASNCSQRETIFLDAFDLIRSHEILCISRCVRRLDFPHPGPREDIAETSYTAAYSCLLAPHSACTELSSLSSWKISLLLVVAEKQRRRKLPAVQLCTVLRYGHFLDRFGCLF